MRGRALTASRLCPPCGRRLDIGTRRSRGRGRFLPSPDYCRDCGRPLTDAAKRRAPLEGYVAFAAAFERRTASWSPDVETA